MQVHSSGPTLDPGRFSFVFIPLAKLTSPAMPEQSIQWHVNFLFLLLMVLRRNTLEGPWVSSLLHRSLHQLAPEVYLCELSTEGAVDN